MLRWVNFADSKGSGVKPLIYGLMLFNCVYIAKAVLASPYVPMVVGLTIAIIIFKTVERYTDEYESK